MSVTMIHIYHADNNPGEIGVHVSMPLDDLGYCIKILQTMDKVRVDVVKILGQRNQDNIKKKKGMFEYFGQMFGMSMSENDKKKLTEDIQKLENAEKIGTGIQNTLNNLAKVLSKVPIEEQQRIIKDINGAVKRITSGG